MIRKISGITSILFFAGAILASCTGMSKASSEEDADNKQDDNPSEMKGVETREIKPENIPAEMKRQAEILQSLGIDGISEDLIKRETEELQNLIDLTDMPVNIGGLKLGRLNIAGMLLRSVGYGNLSKTVYSFEWETYDIDRMYTEFCQGVLKINQNEFTISEISEVDFGDDEQIRIDFKYNDTNYYVELNLTGDWFNMKFFNFFNEVLEKENNPKRLYILGDDQHGAVVFYNTEEWAKEFTRKSGLMLSTKVSE